VLPEVPKVAEVPGVVENEEELANWEKWLRLFF
jgi:hypothetical protein